MKQLFLKDILLRERPVSERLPSDLSAYVYVRKQSGHEVALYVQDDIVRFLDLRDPEQKERFRDDLRTLEIDWDASLRSVKQRHKKDEGKDLSQYDLVIANGLFVDIEDLNERVLYEFDAILERQERKSTTFPTAYFKVAERYDDLRAKGQLSFGELVRLGLIDEDGNQRGAPINQKQSDSIARLQQLRDFDAILDELQWQKPEVSLIELCEDQFWLSRLAQALGNEPKQTKTSDDELPSEEYGAQSIKRLYHRLGLFPTEREVILTPTYQGIWYDDENRFIVGDVNALKLTGQARAHLVRQFVIYQGHDRFDLEAMLNMTSVQFVRHKQYTVYPYPFHLIDLYVDNFLKHQSTL